MSHLSDTDYERLAVHLQTLLERFEGLPHPRVRDDVFELLQCLDALHREGLTRLIDLLEAEAPALLPRLEDDFALRTLMMLYDFIPPDEPPPDPQGDGFVPLDAVDVIEPPKHPLWMPAGRLDDLAPDSMTAKSLGGVSVLLCRLGDDVFALDNACLRSILPLGPGRLEGHVLVCPWHGCRYDVRTGTRLGLADEDTGEALPTFPVNHGDEGRLHVGFNMS